MNYYNRDIRIKVNEKEKESIRLAAEKAGKGMSQFVRDALAERINR